MFKKYTIENTPLKCITLLFSKNNGFKLERIILSTPSKNCEEITQEKYGNLETENCNEIKSIEKEILKYFNHEPYEFSLDYLNLGQCSDFQRKVLLEEFNSQYGSVNTYKEIAKLIGNENSSRAVGNALRNNPFPIIIPCHRTIKTNLEIGGYNGILSEENYKTVLLTHEGHQIKNNKIIPQ